MWRPASYQKVACLCCSKNVNNGYRVIHFIILNVKTSSLKQKWKYYNARSFSVLSYKLQYHSKINIQCTKSKSNIWRSFKEWMNSRMEVHFKWPLVVKQNALRDIWTIYSQLVHVICCVEMLSRNIGNSTCVHALQFLTKYTRLWNFSFLIRISFKLDRRIKL